MSVYIAQMAPDRTPRELMVTDCAGSLSVNFEQLLFRDETVKKRAEGDVVVFGVVLSTVYLENLRPYLNRLWMNAQKGRGFISIQQRFKGVVIRGKKMRPPFNGRI